MGLLDGILKNVSGAPDDVANLAHKLGIDPGVAEKAVVALGQAHQQPGDTVELASSRTGLDQDTLAKMVEHIGGEGSLGEFARMLGEHPQASGIMGMLDRDGDGNPLNDITGMAKGLFGKS